MPANSSVFDTITALDSNVSSSRAQLAAFLSSVNQTILSRLRVWEQALEGHEIEGFVTDVGFHFDWMSSSRSVPYNAVLKRLKVENNWCIADYHYYMGNEADFLAVSFPARYLGGASDQECIAAILSDAQDVIQSLQEHDAPQWDGEKWQLVGDLASVRTLVVTPPSTTRPIRYSLEEVESQSGEAFALELVETACGEWYFQEAPNSQYATPPEGCWCPRLPQTMLPTLFPNEQAARDHVIALVAAAAGVSVHDVEVEPGEGPATQPLQPESESSLSQALRDVIAEHARQTEAEGLMSESAIASGKLPQAAAYYAMANTSPTSTPWLFTDVPCAPADSNRSNLVRAAALLLAEIERLDLQEQSRKV